MMPGRSASSRQRDVRPRRRVSTAASIRKIRTIRTIQLVSAAVVTSLCFLVTPASALDLALFNNPAFVQTGATDGSAEAENLRAALESLGHAVSTYSSTSGGGISEALTGKAVVVIPELENGDLGSSLDPAGVEAYRAHLDAGGGMIVAGTTDQRAATFLNRILESALTTGAVGPGTLTTAALGTIYATAPGVLPENSRTRGIDVGSLPADPLVVYLNGTRAPVARVLRGNGRAVYLGWDWFDGAPLGSQDGGWLTVLGLAVADAGFCRDTSNGDIDGDGIADVCDTVDDLCEDVDGNRALDILPKIIFKKINDDPTAGNDGLTLTGSFELPADTVFGDLDPQNEPFALLIRSNDSAVKFSVTLGTGAYGGKGTVGWRRGRAGRRWTYLDETTSPNGGIIRVVLADEVRDGPGRMRVSVTGKDSTYPFTVRDLPVEAVVIVGRANAGQCAVTDFRSGDCRIGRRGKRLRCGRP